MKQFILSLFAIYSLPANAQLKLPYNQGFEVLEKKVDNWKFYTKNGEYNVDYTRDKKRTGNFSLLIDGKKSLRTQDDNDGGFTQIIIPNKLLVGKKKARIEAWVKTDIHTTHAAIWMNQYSQSNPNDPLNEDITDSVHDYKEWQHLAVEINLRDSVSSTEFGALVNGPGKAWFDDFILYVDDVKVTDILKPAKQPTAKEIAWLNDKTVRLSSIKETTDNADLATLSQWIGNAKVVGVGEPTHGTSETGLFRLRLFQYLAEHKGFNVFMVEDQLPECGLINNYVMGKTDSAFITDYLSKGGATQETLDIVEWMHRYNKSHENKVEFAGMDMQSSKVALDNIKRFAILHDDSLSTDISDLIRLSEGINKNWYDTAGIAAKWPATQKAAAKIKNYTDRKIASYRSLLPKDSVNWFILNVTILKQFFTSSPQERTIPYRDSCMAKNIYDFSKLYPQKKVFVVAHNMHVASSKTDFAKWMGSWLNEYFDSSYYRLAIAVGNGNNTAAESFNHRIYKPYPLQKPYAGTIEYYFEKVKKENFLLSLKNIKGSNVGWLQNQIGFRSIGFIQQEFQFYNIPLLDYFNGIVYIRNTTPTHLLKKQNEE